MNKKFIFTSIAAVALGAMGFFMSPSLDNSSLSSTQLSNIEALSKGWIELAYAKGCEADGDGCALTGGLWFPDQLPVY